jgi:hypothetical protein
MVKPTVLVVVSMAYAFAGSLPISSMAVKDPWCLLLGCVILNGWKDDGSRK